LPDLPLTYRNSGEGCEENRVGIVSKGSWRRFILGSSGLIPGSGIHKFHMSWRSAWMSSSSPWWWAWGWMERTLALGVSLVIHLPFHLKGKERKQMAKIQIIIFISPWTPPVDVDGVGRGRRLCLSLVLFRGERRGWLVYSFYLLDSISNSNKFQVWFIELVSSLQQKSLIIVSKSESTFP